MHCRGSSDKQAIDFDEKLMVFFLHEEELYSWVQQNHFESKLQHVNIDKLRFVIKVSSNVRSLRLESENCLYFKSDS